MAERRRRCTLRGFPYPCDSPLERLQELENKIEDGLLIEKENDDDDKE